MPKDEPTPLRSLFRSEDNMTDLATHMTPPATLKRTNLAERAARATKRLRLKSPVANHSISRLLQLPAEIRNLIYEFALSYNRPLIYTQFFGRPDFRIEPPGHSPKLPLMSLVYKRPNELKLVNRQLYQETRGLALGKNVLCFDTKRKSRAQCVDFLKSITPPWAATIRCIILRVGRLDDERSPTAYSYLRKFCATHPQTQIWLRWATLTLMSDACFVSAALFSALHVRRLLPMYQKLGLDNDDVTREVERLYQASSQKWGWHDHSPPNFKVFPWEESYNEEHFMLHLQKFPGSCHLPGDIQQNTEICRRFVQDCFIHGI